MYWLQPFRFICMHFNSIFYLQVKQIMEEAVTKKFVHEDSSHIIALCSKYTLLCLLSSPSLCRSLSVSVSLWLFVFHPTTLSLFLLRTQCLMQPYSRWNTAVLFLKDPTWRQSYRKCSGTSITRLIITVDLLETIFSVPNTAFRLAVVHVCVICSVLIGGFPDTGFNVRSCVTHILTTHAFPWFFH